MNEIANDILMHYGVKRRSGRYPWGSGDNPYQHSGDFLSRVEDLKKQGKSEKEIAEDLGYSTTELRTYKAVAKDERRLLEINRVKSLQSDGLNVSQIAREMGKNESSIRSLLDADAALRTNQARTTADFLKDQIDKHGAIDVGIGVEKELRVPRGKLEEALTIISAEGYSVHGVGVKQITDPNKQINFMVASKPEITQKDIYKNPSLIKSINDYVSNDGGKTFEKDIFHYPSSLDSKRVMIRYKEEGGIDKDGVIELRRGVEDISLGNSNYAQVRILVDGTHYLKGMAMYSDNMPDGVDVIFNTNKEKGLPKEKVFKAIHTEDPDNPFGSLIKTNGQRYYTDENGKQQLSVINKVREEGDWDTWSKTLSSQMLSKQNLPLIKKQLNLTYADKAAEFDEIKSLTNPTIKRKLLDSFADDCDASAVHLKAAALPRQKAQVILPVTSLKENEIYAPNFKNGETVALIRYPHGGTFEIPVLKVNNKQPEAKLLLGNAIDAVGINSSVAERLSGADFDGDTVVVIPTNDRVKIKTSPALSALEGFDPKTEYGHARMEGTKKDPRYFDASGREFRAMHNTQTEMGKISNLITDMTLGGANTDEIARAVKHSMVVIDAEKHGLDYKRSYVDNNIAELKQKWQRRPADTPRGYSEGAATIISRSSSETEIPKRRGSGRIDKETGEKIFKLANETFIDPKTGKERIRTQKSTRMADTKDAYELVSHKQHPAELAYADYANKMKAMANEARKELVTTEKLKYSPEAKERYSKEVESLDAKLRLAELNAPRERRAQIIATSVVNAKKESNPELNLKENRDQLKKIRQQALTNARLQVGASGKNTKIKISDSEWEAIQAGAISDSKLTKILTKSDADELRMRATPRATTQLSPAKISRIKALNNAGYTTAEIAEVLGVSTSTVSKNLK